MDRREPPMPSVWRLALAWLLFTSSVAAGIYGLAQLPALASRMSGGEARRVVKNRLKSNIKSAPPPVDKPFFYNSVGHAPAADGEGDAAMPPLEPGMAGHLSDGSYTLELKISANRGEAEQMVDEYRDLGVEAYYTPLARAGKVLYRIRRGIYPSRRAAERAAVDLRQRQAVEAKVVQLQ